MRVGRIRSAGAIPLALVVFSLAFGAGTGVAADADHAHDWPWPRVFAPKPVTGDVEVRAIDGIGNNEYDPLLGCAGYTLLRVCLADYGDGTSTMAGADRASPRAISNLVCAQSASVENEVDASDFVWQWGQFLDHDIDLTPGTTEAAYIPVPTGDPYFDPNGTGTAVIPFERSVYAAGSSPRQQLNVITSFVDASNVYGSDETRALALRTLDGTGRLKTSAGDLLPWNTGGLPNAPTGSASFFLAGDVRANEQVALTAMHTLFMREHNRLADYFHEQYPGLSGDEVYESARRVVGAEIQVITYEEFLPVLLGQGALKSYKGYDSTVDPTISNVFSTACYRLGHSLLSPFLLRLDGNGDEISAGHLPLREAFFAPYRIVDEGGIEPLLRGLAAQRAQRIDPLVVDDVRNFLFGNPGEGGFDLASLNIQRGRDHGLPCYNDVREQVGLDRMTSFADVTSDPGIRARLAAAYATVDDIDAWVGGLCEDHLKGAMVGELLFTVLKDQFERLRDGDRFWYERTLSSLEVAAVRKTRLADIIRRNTGIGSEIQDDVFLVGKAK